MKIEHFLDATYLKTASQAGVTNEANYKINIKSIQEAIDYNFKLIMIRPEFVSVAKKMIAKAKAKVTVGTVIDFPLGQNPLEYKLEEAQNAMDDGADDLDFVVNYEAYKEGRIELVKAQILSCTALGLSQNKIVKWIIEVAALNDSQIIGLSTLIKNIVISNFKENQYENVYVKSSTGFYKTKDNLPNGATFHSIKIMLENSFPLSVKAAGGVRNYEEAIKMIKLGVKRIGTSSAKAILEGKTATNDY